MPKEMSLQCCLKIDRDPAFRIGVGRLFHHPGMVNENVLESDFEPFNLNKLEYFIKPIKKNVL